MLKKTKWNVIASQCAIRIFIVIFLIGVCFLSSCHSIFGLLLLKIEFTSKPIGFDTNEQIKFIGHGFANTKLIIRKHRRNEQRTRKKKNMEFTIEWNIKCSKLKMNLFSFYFHFILQNFRMVHRQRKFISKKRRRRRNKRREELTPLFTI